LNFQRKRAIMFSMKKTDVIAHFGSISETSKALKISFQAVHQWPETVPLLRAYHIERLTRGKLKADPPGKPNAKS